MSAPPIINQYNPPQPYKLNKATINLLTPFVPTQLPNLALWLDANDLTKFSFSSGSNISEWKDKSINNNIASPVAVSNAPAYDSNASGVLFTNNNTGAGGIIQGLTTAYTGSSLESLFIVMNVGNLDQNSVFIYGNSNRARVAYVDNLSNLTVSSNGLADRINIGGIIQEGIITLVDILFNDGSKLNNYVNGLNSASNTSFTLFSQSSNTTIGTDNYIGSNSFNGYIYEIIIYSNILSDSDRQKVESYLAYKWGPLLDPSNPYYQTAYSNYLYPFINSNILLSNPVSINTNQFSPLNIGNLALWLDSADTRTFSFSSGSNISQWRDKSRNNFHAAPDVLSNAPVNTVSGVSFTNTNTGPSGTVQGLTTNYIGNTSESIFIVLNSSNVSAQGFLISPLSPNGRFIFINSSSNLITATSGATSNLLNAGTVSNSRPTVVDIIFNNGSNLNHYINGTNVGTFASFTSFTTGSNTYIANDIYSGNKCYNGIINEIIIYSNALSTQERQQVESYLASKWNIPLDTTNQYYPNSLIQLYPNKYSLISNYLPSIYTMRNITF